MTYFNIDSDENKTAKTVCIVGAGQSGLVSIKECVVQGLKPTCYELDSDLGGMWRPRDPKEPSNVPAIWPSFITNTSKWANAFSDFDALPSHAPFQTQQGLFEYFQQYTSHFKLDQYIHFNTRVVWIRKTKDHEETGRWEVFTCPTAQFRNGEKRVTKMTPDEREQLLLECKKETFDCVLICSGCYKYPIYPDIEGMSTFEGDIHHSFNYTDPKIYEDKRVLIVGNRFSAMDIANDVTSVSKQTYLAIGSGSWILPRVHTDGRTVEQLLTRYFIYRPDSGKCFKELIISIAQSRLDHVSIGIAPKDPQVMTAGCSDDLQVKIMSGRVQTYGRLAKLTSRDAYFNDGSVIKDLDSIIFATGAGVDLSFLDAQIIAPDGKMELYKTIFPANEESKHTLAFVGIIAVDSQAAIVSEVEARLATRVFAGRQSLPSKQVMKKDADYWNNMNWLLKGSYKYYLPGTLIMDGIAQTMGVYPSFWKLLVKDPRLAYRFWYGGVVGAHYRLVGPDSNWESARKSSHALYEEGLKCIRNITSTAADDATHQFMANINTKRWFALLSFTTTASAIGLFFLHKNHPDSIKVFNVFKW